MRLFFAISIVIVLCVVPAAQQQSRLGAISFPTSGSAEAQPYFLDGLKWLYNFGYEEATEAFQKAEALDPGFVMAYWGEALSYTRPTWYVQDLPAARRALARLGPTPESRAAKAGTAREQGYLQALEILYGEGDKASRDAAYAGAMKRLVEQYPDDEDAACLYALALLGAMPLDQHDQYAPEAGAIAERVFSKNPNHPGAAHILIHAYDNREHASRALPAARAYATIAPDSSHALHMPAHIFLQLGMWDEAAASDEASWAASVQRVMRRRLPIAARDYHSLSWLAYEYLQQGRFQKAREALKPFEEVVQATGDAKLKDDLTTVRAYYLVETERWTEARGQVKFDNADELFAIGMSAAKLGDLDRARAVLGVLQKIASADPDELRRTLAAIMGHEIVALVQLAEGRPSEAIAAIQRAAASEQQLPRPVGRPHPVKPSHELYGEVLLDAGRPAEAAKQFEQSLWRAANRSRSVLGLARAARQLGDMTAARARYAKFLENWRLADAGLPELAEAERLVRQGPATPGRRTRSW